MAAIPHHNDGVESLFIALRCIHVETHLQIGNALCNRASLRPDPKKHGISVEVFMRQQSNGVSDPTKVFVYFLARQPQAAAVEALSAVASVAPCKVQGADLYVHHPKEAGRAELTIELIESRLHATCRNWRSVVTSKGMLEQNVVIQQQELLLTSAVRLISDMSAVVHRYFVYQVALVAGRERNAVSLLRFCLHILQLYCTQNREINKPPHNSTNKSMLVFMPNGDSNCCSLLSTTASMWH